jgi:hypothetical protein
MPIKSKLSIIKPINLVGIILAEQYSAGNSLVEGKDNKLSQLTGIK